MEVLKIKEWKQKKDDLQQFNVIATILLSRGSIIKRVIRTMDGSIFELNKVFLDKKGNTFKITEFHKDFKYVSFKLDDFGGETEINNIIINDDEFIGFYKNFN